MTVDEFKAVMPEFSAVEAPIIQRALAESVTALTASRWGSLYARGLRHWVAHEVAMERNRSATGPDGKAGDVTYLSLETTNGAARSQRGSDAVIKQMENPYMRTKYGQEFYRLLRIVGAGTLAST